MKVNKGALDGFGDPPASKDKPALSGRAGPKKAAPKKPGQKAKKPPPPG